MSRNRPSIFQVGRVHDDGHTVTVAGWSLGPCMHRCRCHYSPFDYQIGLVEDERGLLGLRSWIDCNCCSPWTADELAAVLADLRALDDVVTTAEREGQP